jgi:hypothetical protein
MSGWSFGFNALLRADRQVVIDRDPELTFEASQGVCLERNYVVDVFNPAVENARLTHPPRCGRCSL